MSRPKVKVDVTLYPSEWWNRLAVISEKGLNEKPVERSEPKSEKPSFLSALSSMLDSLVDKRLVTSIVKMN